MTSTAPTGRGTLRQPPGLYLLFLVEMWERFSYYGMRALLVLYLVSLPTAENAGPGWTKGDANLLYGWYTGLAYLLPIAGGFIADRFIGTHRSMIVGGLLIAAGHITLAVSGLPSLHGTESSMSVFIAGLALIILGTGHFKPCVSVMVGQLYGPEDPRRDGGFTIFYMGINLGAFICAFVCGTVGERVGWHWGFGCAAVGMLIGLAIYIAFRDRHLKEIGLAPHGRRDFSRAFFALSAAVAIGVGVAYHVGFFRQLRTAMDSIASTGSWIIPVVVVGALAAFCGWLIGSQRKADRGPVGAILVFILFNTFFWMAFEQAGSTLNLFAESETDRSLGSFEVPATWFQSINPLLIILLAPAFAAIWSRLGARGRDPTQATKIAMGLLLLGLGYLFVVEGARRAAAGVDVSMLWLVGTYTFHTLGELCLSPTGLAFVTKAAPARSVSLLMGVWFLSSFAAGVIGGLVGSMVEQVEKGEVSLPWYGWFRLGGQADFFLLFVISSFAGAMVIFVLGPAMRKLLHRNI